MMATETKAPRRVVTGRGAEQSNQRPYSSTSAAPVERLLDRLDKVRANGRDRWMACCPAHNDRSPSLSIKEATDGTALVHCFAGCDPGDILAAIGLEMRDLFPWRPDRSKPRLSGPSPRKIREMREAFLNEETVIRVAAGTMERGEKLSHQDCERVALAWDRRRKIARQFPEVLK